MAGYRSVLPAMAVAVIGLTGTAAAADISGAGATFPYPIYAKWAEAYKAKTGANLNYQSIGSGGGIKQITAGTVDFGATDMPLKPAALARDGLVQWPQIIGGIVLAVNLKGVAPGRLKLDGNTVAGMYLGRITKWNDPAVARLNPGLALPDKAVATIHRSDGSGTNFVFTHYLSSVDPEFRDKIGENTSVDFPGGLGGKGNEGVAALTGRTDGAIGYIEYAFTVQNKITYTLLQNHDGAFVAPDRDSFQAAAANADWGKSPAFYVLLTDQPGAQSWPITGASFILMHKQQPKPDRARQVLDFFDWAFRNGEPLAEQLHYVAMPDNVVKIVEQSWRQILGPDGKPLWDGSAAPGSTAR